MPLSEQFLFTLSNYTFALLLFHFHSFTQFWFTFMPDWWPPGSVMPGERQFSFSQQAENSDLWKFYSSPLHHLMMSHSLIISREVLILTPSIFNALNVCISWYSLCPRECTEKYFPRECISRTLPRENIGNTSSRGKHWQCSGNDESSSLMIYRRQAKCQDNGCNRKIITWTF